MSLLWALVILVVVIALSVAAMLLVRRTAPAGSYFEDGDRASKLTAQRLQRSMLVMGAVLFLATLVWVVTSPVSIAV